MSVTSPPIVTESPSQGDLPLVPDWLVRGMPVATILLDASDRIVVANEAFSALFGYAEAELIGHDPRFLVHPDDLPALLTDRRGMRGPRGTIVESGGRGIGRDGRTIHARTRSRVVEHAGQRFVLSVVLPDETAAGAESDRVPSADPHRGLFEDSPVATAVQRVPGFELVRVNRAFVELTGYDEATLIGMDPIALWIEEDQVQAKASREAFMARAPGVAQTLRRGEEYEYRLRHKSGKIVPIRIKYQETRQPTGRFDLVMVLIDMSVEAAARAVAEEQSRRVWRNFELAPVGMVIRDENLRVAAVNRAFTRLTGFRPEEVIGKKDIFTVGTSPAVYAAVERKWSSISPQVGRVGKVRLPIRTRDGREVWTERISTRIDDADSKPAYLTVVTDVTPEHLLSEELKRVVLQQGALLRSTAAGVAHVVTDTVIRVNSSMERMLARPGSEIQGGSVADLLGCDVTWASVRDTARDELAKGGAYSREVVVHRPGLPDLVCEATLRSMDAEAPDLGMILTLVDISELKAQQAALQRRNAELEALIENSAVAIAYLESGSVVRNNRLLETILGLGPRGLIGEPMSRWVRSDDTQLFEAMRGNAERARSVTGKAGLTLPDGVELPCILHVQAVDPAHAPGAAIFVAIDLSEQQATEIQLQAVRERFQRFAEVVDELTMVVDSAIRQPRYCNGRLESVLGVSLETFYRDPMEVFSRVNPSDRARVIEACARSRTEPLQEIDLHVDHPAKGPRLVRFRLCGSVGELDEVYCTGEDVTDHRRMEQQRIDEALKQRDMLVREVHHRIKNNLQGVAGLLQQIAQRRPEVAGALDEIAGQIQAIAQVHGLQVRDTQDLAPLGIVEAMMQNLGRNFGLPLPLACDNREAMGQWVIPEQEAVPLALVINELGTNAIKHRTASGAVNARLSGSSEGVELVVANAGTLPVGFDFAALPPSPSGLGLVKAMLPRRGTQLAFRQIGPLVQVSLRLAPPAIRRR